MRFHEAANYLFDLRRTPPRPGTKATADLLAHLGDPQDEYACVQIAGSNGKGSTARMVESILREAGLDVGLYTSPHLESVRERVKVNGRNVTRESLTTYIEAVEEYVTNRASEGEAPTFFETVTALALWEFSRQDVDVAILEVGIGGRYDATSVVDPIASAVTSISLEHTEMLGDDVETIARDKATVAPEDNPLVTAATGEALSAIQDAVHDSTVVSALSESAATTTSGGEGCEEGRGGDGSGEGRDGVGRGGEGSGATAGGERSGGETGGETRDADVTVQYHGREGLEGKVTVATGQEEYRTFLPLLGSHQAENAGVAVALARQVADSLLAGQLASSSVERGLRNAFWAGRFEVMEQHPLVILDGAHTPAGCRRVAETLGEFDVDDVHLVVGSMADKNHRGIAAALSDVDFVTACEPLHERTEAKEAIAHAFEAETAAEISTRADVAGALNDALSAAEEDDCVLVTGSLYTVGEARTRWTRPQVPKRAASVDEARSVLERANVTAAGTWRMGGKGVHRIVRTRVQPKQAGYLKEELLSLGGECAVSGVDPQPQEYVDVVMMGTMAQFKRLCEKLEGQPHGLSPFAAELRQTLSIGVERPAWGYPWEEGTAVMGILNVTPDSFHDGGAFDAEDDAVERAVELVAAGADIVDVGGESTRPGADPVSIDEEKARVLPVVERIDDLDALVSIDTRKAEVARAALDAGADILNDVSGLSDPEMRTVAAEYDVPTVIMHSIDAPVDPSTSIHYDDVVEDVIRELNERVLLAEKAGLDRSQIVVDPGVGFGKSAAENFELLERLGEFRALGCPILVGHSHKSMFGDIGSGPEERYEATIAASALAADRGADIVRVHDVAGNAAAIDVFERMREER